MSTPIIRPPTRLPDAFRSLSPQVKAALITACVLGFASVANSGLQLWQKATENRASAQHEKIEELRAERELYERLQILQQQALSEIPRYIVLRHLRFPAVVVASAAAGMTNRAEPTALADWMQTAEYNSLLLKLVSLIKEYHRLEVKLSLLERRPARPFIIPLPPMPIADLKVASNDGTNEVFVWAPPPKDPLIERVEKDMQELTQEYAHRPR